VPLRSVEAATRDDAIAAAREQFGPSARVVGVRRVRSGGVLGFFATERYVAEVAPDLTNRPAVPATPTTAADDVPADFSSPLASAAPARARAAAPARNGAAARPTLPRRRRPHAPPRRPPAPPSRRGRPPPCTRRP
jgi:flagellar biosynthesis GTPase FlhF